MASREYMISDYYRIRDPSDHVQPVAVSGFAALALLVGIGVGVRILRQVKGQHFADDAVSLL